MSLASLWKGSGEKVKVKRQIGVQLISGDHERTIS